MSSSSRKLLGIDITLEDTSNRFVRTDDDGVEGDPNLPHVEEDDSTSTHIVESTGRKIS